MVSQSLGRMTLQAAVAITSANSLLAATRARLRRFGLRARKGLGQHFLVDRGALERILEAAELAPHDTVLEVGPGLGLVTEELLARAGRVVAVEIDPGQVAALRELLGTDPKLTLVQGDMLELSPEALVGKGPYKVVANLPYFVAAPILRRFLEATAKPQLMVVMVQREVAENMVAPPGRMGLFSVSVQLYGQPRLVCSVPARSFYPAPQVDSAVVRIEVFPQPRVPVADTSAFFAVVRAGFAAPRKQLGNTLAQGLSLPPGEVKARLAALGLDPQRRPQTLALEEWARLYQAFSAEVSPEAFP